jgi:hypothetical protein
VKVLCYDERRELPLQIREILKQKVFSNEVEDVQSGEVAKFRTGAPDEVQARRINDTIRPSLLVGDMESIPRDVRRRGRIAIATEAGEATEEVGARIRLHPSKGKRKLPWEERSREWSEGPSTIYGGGRQRRR